MKVPYERNFSTLQKFKFMLETAIYLQFKFSNLKHLGSHMMLDS
uniref:Uncharacterized protein n=1 Tax=Rhizophora mucronata TaxID=61149 RepID=A0A2P2NX63_RHIMU